MSAQLHLIRFYDDTLAAVMHDETPHVSTRHVCDALGVAHQPQHRKLRSAKWSCVTILMTHDASGRTQELSVIPVRALPMWMATIQPGKVSPEVRGKLERFQSEAAEVLARHFFGDPKPAAPAVPTPTPAPSTPTSLIRQTIEALRAVAIEQDAQAARLAAAEQRVDGLAGKIAAIEDRRSQAEEGLRALSPPTVEPPGKSLIDEVEQRVRLWIGAHQPADFRAGWRRYYEEIRRRLGVNVKARFNSDQKGEKRYRTKLDVLRALGPESQAQAHALACLLFPSPS